LPEEKRRGINKGRAHHLVALPERQPETLVKRKIIRLLGSVGSAEKKKDGVVTSGKTQASEGRVNKSVETS